MGLDIQCSVLGRTVGLAFAPVVQLATPRGPEARQHQLHVGTTHKPTRATRPNKHKYAINRLTGKPNILVDDKPDNIKRWQNAGGYGYRYQADEDDVNDLIKRLKKLL